MTQDMDRYWREGMERLRKKIEHQSTPEGQNLEKLLCFKGERCQRVDDVEGDYHFRFVGDGFVLRGAQGNIPPGEACLTGAYYEQGRYLLVLRRPGPEMYFIGGSGVEFP